MVDVIQDSLQQAGPLLILALVILSGVALGEFARLMRVPAITGQIFAGMLLGTSGLNLFADDSLEGLQPLTQFALSLIAVTVGAHLNIRRLRNAGKRLFFLLLTESIITPSIVFTVLWWVAGVSVSEAILYAAVAIATAPATIIALVKETRSKGVFVKTLIAAVALNNMACIFLFEIARAVGVGLHRLADIEAAARHTHTQLPMGRGQCAVARIKRLESFEIISDGETRVIVIPSNTRSASTRTGVVSSTAVSMLPSP